MIDGLALEYAQARAAARLARRPDEARWGALTATRGLPALLDAGRNARLAPPLTGIAPDAAAAAIDRAFRTQCRAAIEEVERWAPAEWRAAVRRCAELLDLPSAAAAREAQRDTAAPQAPADPTRRPDQAPARAADHAPARAARAPALHAALAEWRARWRADWPAHRTHESLGQFADAVARHVERFGALAPEDAAAERGALAQLAARTLRRHAAEPVALFAYLLVQALDLERLRALCLQRAVPPAYAPARAAPETPP